MDEWVCLVSHLVVVDLVGYDVLRYIMTSINRVCLMRLNIIMMFHLILMSYLAICNLRLTWGVHRLMKVMVELGSIVVRGWIAHSDELVAHLRISLVLVL